MLGNLLFLIGLTLSIKTANSHEVLDNLGLDPDTAPAPQLPIASNTPTDPEESIKLLADTAVKYGPYVPGSGKSPESVQNGVRRNIKQPRTGVSVQPAVQPSSSTKTATGPAVTNLLLTTNSASQDSQPSATQNRPSRGQVDKFEITKQRRLRDLKQASYAQRQESSAAMPTPLSPEQKEKLKLGYKKRPTPNTASPNQPVGELPFSQADENQQNSNNVMAQPAVTSPQNNPSGKQPSSNTLKPLMPNQARPQREDPSNVAQPQSPEQVKSLHQKKPAASPAAAPNQPILAENPIPLQPAISDEASRKRSVPVYNDISDDESVDFTQPPPKRPRV